VSSVEQEAFQQAWNPIEIQFSYGKGIVSGQALTVKVILAILGCLQILSATEGVFVVEQVTTLRQPFG